MLEKRSRGHQHVLSKVLEQMSLVEKTQVERGVQRIPMRYVETLANMLQTNRLYECLGAQSDMTPKQATHMAITVSDLGCEPADLDITSLAVDERQGVIELCGGLWLEMPQQPTLTHFDTLME